MFLLATNLMRTSGDYGKAVGDWVIRDVSMDEENSNCLHLVL